MDLGSCSLGRGCCPCPAQLLGRSWEMPHGPRRRQSLLPTQHNTWPQGRQDCFSKVTLPARDPGSPKLGPKADEPSLTCPHQATLPSPGLSPWYPRNYRMGKPPPHPQTPQHSSSVEAQCPHRSASRPRIHPPYAILTWTPVLPEKQAVCVHASGWRGDTTPSLSSQEP